MRKFLTMILALAMVMSMATVAFADTIETDGGTSGGWVDVVINTSTQNPVYYVDVTWDSMVFTYSFGSTPKWDPESHTYITESSEGVGWYVGEHAGVEEASSRVLVVNHSNAAVKVQAAWENGEPKWPKGVTVTLDTQEHVLESAAVVAYGEDNIGHAANASIEVTVSGTPESNEEATAQVIVTISAVNP